MQPKAACTVAQKSTLMLYTHSVLQLHATQNTVISSNLPICLCAGTWVFRVVTVGVEVVLVEDVVLGADVVGPWTDGVPEAGVLALGATLEITVLRAAILSTVGCSLPVI